MDNRGDSSAESEFEKSILDRKPKSNNPSIQNEVEVGCGRSSEDAVGQIAPVPRSVQEQNTKIVLFNSLGVILYLPQDLWQRSLL